MALLQFKISLEEQIFFQGKEFLVLKIKLFLNFVFNKEIDLKSFDLHRDNPPAWEYFNTLEIN